MDFGERIKSIRRDRNLSQEQMAKTLGVSRQAVSNWENNRNLPDIEMIISIAKEFDLSLDQLILGGQNDMTSMAEKLIRDGSDTQRARFNSRCIAGGAVTLIAGLACLVIKGLSVEYVDATGVLHENFFLLPLGFLLLACGSIAFLLAGTTSLANAARHEKGNPRQIAISIASLGVFAIVLMAFITLWISNSGIL